jgi:hypothetical protein
MAGVELRHCLLVRQDARAMILGVGIAVELRERGDIVGLALGFGAKLPRLLQRCPSIGQVLRRRRREGVGEEGHGNPPIRHRALGIALQHVGERIVRGFIPERVLQLHRVVERLLRLRRAGDREVNRAEHRMTGMLIGGVRWCRHQTQENRQETVPGTTYHHILHDLPAGVWRRQVRRVQYFRRLTEQPSRGRAAAKPVPVCRSLVPPASAHRQWLSIEIESWSALL